MEEKWGRLAEWIHNAKKITVLTGAGISTESGIPDFRSSQGAFWLNHEEQVKYITRSYFEQHPVQFWPVFKEIFNVKMGQSYEPNSGHFFLAELEQRGKDVKIFTQNIDGLHSKAGSTQVYEVHGTIQKAFCPRCHAEYELAYCLETAVPHCCAETMKGLCNTVLKPDVVLFGDNIHYWFEAQHYVEESDLFIVMGSSLQVGPVNELPRVAHTSEKQKTVLVNRDATPMDGLFDLVFHAGIGETCRAVRERLMADEDGA